MSWPFHEHQAKICYTQRTHTHRGEKREGEDRKVSHFNIHIMRLDYTVLTKTEERVVVSYVSLRKHNECLM